MAQVVHDCSHCFVSNSSMLVVGQGYGRFTTYFFCICPSCVLPVTFEVASPNGRISDVTSNPMWTPQAAGLSIVDFWPKPPATTDVAHLPEAIAKAYAAAERNFPVPGMEEASGGSYGRALDLAIKLIDPTLKGTLYARIEALAKAHKLTPDLAQWAHEIRELRNEALHEVDSMSREDLTAIRGFTEMILRYLFALPGMLAARKAGVPAGAGP